MKEVHINDYIYDLNDDRFYQATAKIFDPFFGTAFDLLEYNGKNFVSSTRCIKQCFENPKILVEKTKDHLLQIYLRRTHNTKLLKPTIF